MMVSPRDFLFWSLIVGIITTGVFIVIVEPGPRWLWVSDACPTDPTMTCSQLAIGPLVTGVSAAAAIWSIKYLPDLLIGGPYGQY